MEQEVATHALGAPSTVADSDAFVSFGQVRGTSNSARSSIAARRKHNPRSEAVFEPQYSPGRVSAIQISKSTLFRSLEPHCDCKPSATTPENQSIPPRHGLATATLAGAEQRCLLYEDPFVICELSPALLLYALRPVQWNRPATQSNAGNAASF